MQAAKELWEILIQTASLHAHLDALKAYLLAGCGDHLLAFLVQVHMSSPEV